MVNLEHKKYGNIGSEFILHHHTLQPKRLMASLVVTTTLTAVFNLHEMVTRTIMIIIFLGVQDSVAPLVPLPVLQDVLVMSLLQC